MAYVTNFDHHLVIDDVPLSTPAWEHINLYGLYSSGAVRGDNRVMPGAVGVRALRRRPTQTNRTLDLVIFGDRQPDGTPNADAIAGLFANIAALNALADPLATANSTRAATIVRPGAGSLSAAVQILGFTISDEHIGPWVAAASMDITVIEGAFA